MEDLEQAPDTETTAPLRPEDVVLKNQQPRRRILTGPPRKPAPPWWKYGRIALAVVTPVVGLGLLAWRMQPADPFHPPPSSVKVEHVRVVEHEGMTVLQGDVTNMSGRAARRITYKVEYRLDGQDRSSFVVVQNVPNEGAITFTVPLVRSQPDGAAVIGPGKAPRLEGEPKFTPYDSQW